MKQKILHCSNTENLQNQLIEAGYYHQYNDGRDNEPYLPVEAEGMSVNKDNQRLTCVLLNTSQEAQINKIESLTILGTYPEIFDNPEKLKIYDSIYDRSEKTEIDPETKEEVTHKPPDKFSEFALPEPDPDEAKKQKEVQRKKMLADSVDIVQTHNEQKDLGVPTDISDEQYKQTLQFRESLRKM